MIEYKRMKFDLSPSNLNLLGTGAGRLQYSLIDVIMSDIEGRRFIYAIEVNHKIA